MIEAIKKLEFVGEDFEWLPHVTGNAIADYKYGYECASQYSEIIMMLMARCGSEDLIRTNAKFRMSIDPETPAGRGFLAGIRGLKSEY